MSAILVLLLSVGPVAATIAAAAPVRGAPAATIVAGIVSLTGALTLVSPAGEGTLTAGGYLRADALSVVFLLATALLYAVTAVYSVGYLRAEEGDPGFAKYSRRFYVGLNLFAGSMLAAPVVNGLALLWIAIEVTTVISALLVAIDGTDGAVEAAWKYVLIASVGLGIALLATIMMYYAGAQVFGQSFDLAVAPLVQAGARLPHTAVRLAFVLAVLGFGTKVGLVPVHTWLPDAHSEAPTPVSAMLSGSLLVVSFYAVLRYYQIALRTLGPAFPQGVLLVFGILSLLLAALYLLDQQDVKRMLAYSSVEHMGVLAVGVSFGAPIALSGVLLHVLAHAAAKGTAFLGAGVLVRKYHTKDIASLRGGLDLLPWTGPVFLLSVLALSAAPPFGIFRSEFQIVAGGLADGHRAAGAILVVLVTLAFFGLGLATTRMLFLPVPESAAADGGRLRRGEPSAWMVGPMVACLLVLLLLGVHPPADLQALLARGVAELQSAP